MIRKFTVAECQTPRGTFFVLDNDEFIGETAKQGKHWEEKLVSLYDFILRPDGTCLDIGSHVGMHTIPMSRVCRRVYAFEVQSVMKNLLDMNVLKNEAQGVKTFNRAVGHRQGIPVSIGARVTDGSSSGHQLDYNSQQGVNYGGLQITGNAGEVDHVEMLTVDSMNLVNVQLMKVDVEGFEPAVFYGARNTIRKYRPVILYERNYKTITEEMLRTIEGLTDEVVNFDIEKFCAELDYHKPIIIGPDRILVPKSSRIHIADEFQGGITYDYESNSFEIPGRGRFPLYNFNSGFIVHFPDYGDLCAGGLTKEGDILWSNGSMWLRPRPIAASSN